MALYEEALGRQHTVLGPDHPLTLKTRRGLAECHEQLGRTDPALATYRDVLERWRRTAGPTARETLVTLSGLAVCLQRSGDSAAAIEAFREAHAGLQAALGSGHPQTVGAAYSLANMYRDAERFGPAIPLYHAAAEHLLSPRNRSSPMALILIASVAHCYERERRHEAGRDRLREYLRVVQLRTDARRTERLNLLLALAKYLNRLRGYADAEAAVRDCMRNTPPDATPSAVALVRSQLGVALFGQGKYTEAEPELLAAYAEFDRLERG